MKTFEAVLLVACLIAVLSAAVAQEPMAPPPAPRTYFLDQKHPAAADANEGTEAAPLKTFQAAVEKLRPGDTLYIKAGIYKGTVVFPHGGAMLGQRQDYYPCVRIPTYITVVAYQDDKVIVDGADELPRDAWQPVEGQAGVYVAKAQPHMVDFGPGGGRYAGKVTSAYFNGKRLNPSLRRIDKKLTFVVPEKDQTGTFFHDEKEGKLYVNLGGADPRKDGLVEMAAYTHGLYLCHQDYLCIHGLTVQRFNDLGINAGRTNGTTIEDCQATQCYHGIGVGLGDNQIVRRCRVYDVAGIGINTGSGQAARVYDNVVYAAFRDWFKTGNIFHCYSFIQFGARFPRYFHNVAVGVASEHSKAGGFWPDCYGPSHWYVGNVAAHLQTGFYIEAPSYGNVIQYNTSSHNGTGISVRGNFSNLFAENYVNDCAGGMCLATTEDESWPVANNCFVRNWIRIRDGAQGIQINCEPGGLSKQTLNFVQRNVYDRSDKGWIGAWGGKRFRTLKEFQDETRQDSLAEERAIDPQGSELGLVWFRVDDTDSSHMVLPMFGNPTFERLATDLDEGKYFWRPGDGHGSDVIDMNANAVMAPARNPAYPYMGRGKVFTKGAKFVGAICQLNTTPVEGTPVKGIYINVPLNYLFSCSGVDPG